MSRYVMLVVELSTLIGKNGFLFQINSLKTSVDLLAYVERNMKDATSGIAWILFLTSELKFLKNVVNKVILVQWHLVAFVSLYF